MRFGGDESIAVRRSQAHHPFSFKSMAAAPAGRLSPLASLTRIAPCLTVVIIWLFPGIARAQYEPPADYYHSATGSGITLKNALNSIIDGHTSISYSNREAPLKRLDQDPANSNNLLLVYTGSSGLKSEFPAGSINTEHLWPNSYGIDDTNPAYGDLFNLRPCNLNANSERANLYYDNGGSAASTAPQCRKTALSWEPRDAEKGDLARALFYMDTRYQNDAGDGFARDLALTDSTASIGSTATYMGKLSSLVAWHFLDPVSDAERARNQLIYTDYQHNRNPYVDHPEFVWAVFGAGPNNSQLHIGTDLTADGSSVLTLNLRTMKATSLPAQSIILTKAGSHPTTFNVTTTGLANSIEAGQGLTVVGGPQSRTLQVGLLAEAFATPGLRTGALIVDNTDLTSNGPGQGSADADDVVTLQVSVLEHARGTFSPGAEQQTLVIDFGNVPLGTGSTTRAGSIWNLDVSSAGFTAGLDVDAITGSGDTTRLLIDLVPFQNLAASAHHPFVASVDASNAGSFGATYTLAVSDENIPGAIAGKNLTLTLKAHVFVPVAADFDRDGDVDLLDVARFISCSTGPGQFIQPECDYADLDGDGDADQVDFGLMQRCFGGSGVLAPADCLP